MIPAAENVEGAADSLRTLPDRVKQDQRKELLEAIGQDTAGKLGLSWPVSEEAVTGYQLGLQTARMILAGSAELIRKGVDPAKVL
jgi:hypothetical protein